jgi:erythromycin esterase-like protein
MMMRALIAATAFLGLTVSPAFTDTASAQDDFFDESEMDDADADAFFEEFMGSVRRDEADRERCANTRDTVSKDEQYDACTRLIEDASNENDLVGT